MTDDEKPRDSTTASREAEGYESRYAEKYAFNAGRWLVDKSTMSNQELPEAKVQFQRLLTKFERIFMCVAYIFCMVAGLGASGMMLWVSHLPEMETITDKVAFAFAIPVLFLNECLRLVGTTSLFFFCFFASNPVPMQPEKGLRVAFITTIVPSKEPIDVAMASLLEAKKIRYAAMYNGTMDVWLLDEGNVPEIKELCEKNGIKHFSRNGIPEYNQESGFFRRKTKHGNHNAWRDQHDQNYDFVAVIDPDHVPTKYFLERLLGYFRDPDIAFVLAPQKYGNYNESWIANAASMQSYIFHAVVQRGLNGCGCHAFLEGTNHVYRVKAFQQIGGYQDSISEDFYTCLILYATLNPRTGNTWRGAFTPDIISVGEGPSTFTDYYNQQKRWSYGVVDLLLKKSLKQVSKLKGYKPKIAYTMLHTFYLIMAYGLLSSIYTSVLMTFAQLDYQFNFFWWVLWVFAVVGSVGLFIWTRRFNLVPEECLVYGLLGLALFIMTFPIYLEAALTRLSGSKLYFCVTAKGNLASSDCLQTFRSHIYCIIILVVAIGLNFCGFGSQMPVKRLWLFVILASCLLPIIVHYCTTLSSIIGDSTKDITEALDKPESATTTRQSHCTVLSSIIGDSTKDITEALDELESATTTRQSPHDEETCSGLDVPTAHMLSDDSSCSPSDDSSGDIIMDALDDLESATTTRQSPHDEETCSGLDVIQREIPNNGNGQYLTLQNPVRSKSKSAQKSDWRFHRPLQG